MMRPSRRTVAKLVLVGVLAGGAITSVSGSGAADEARPAGHEAASRGGASRDSAAPGPARPPAPEGLDPLETRYDGERLLADLPEGRTAVLSLDVHLQGHLEDELARYEVPYGAVVVMEPGSGRVLAYVSHSTANPGAGDLVRDTTPPTASVFKIVTAAALVDAGVGADRRVCYGGGASRLVAADLEDDPSRDRWCVTLADAMGRSLNAVFAKLADRHLDRATLERYASAFGFGHALPFDVPTRPSPAEVPSDRLERARTAAGFWHMHMSPLHGALIAATIANDGKMPRASVVDRVMGRDGAVLYRHEPEVFRPVVPRDTARVVASMMVRTVSGGTARKWFFDPRGNPFVPGIDVAGKTGTLTGTDPYRGYNWFVGFAPADNPEVAVSALVVNEPRWRIKASYLGREALREWLVERPRREARRRELEARERPEGQAPSGAEAAE